MSENRMSSPTFNNGEQLNDQVELVVRGESALEKELTFAKAIPSDVRILLRQESSLEDLLTKKDEELS